MVPPMMGNRYATLQVRQLTTFIVEPFLHHPANTEFYVCITSTREADVNLFTREGGVDIGDVDAKAHRLAIKVGAPLTSRDTVRARCRRR